MRCLRVAWIEIEMRDWIERCGMHSEFENFLSGSFNFYVGLSCLISKNDYVECCALDFEWRKLNVVDLLWNLLNRWTLPTSGIVNERSKAYFKLFLIHHNQEIYSEGSLKYTHSLKIQPQLKCIIKKSLKENQRYGR